MKKETSHKVAPSGNFAGMMMVESGGSKDLFGLRHATVFALALALARCRFYFCLFEERRSLPASDSVACPVAAESGAASNATWSVPQKDFRFLGFLRFAEALAAFAFAFAFEFTVPGTASNTWSTPHGEKDFRFLGLALFAETSVALAVLATVVALTGSVAGCPATVSVGVAFVSVVIPRVPMAVVPSGLWPPNPQTSPAGDPNSGESSWARRVFVLALALALAMCPPLGSLSLGVSEMGTKKDSCGGRACGTIAMGASGGGNWGGGENQGTRLWVIGLK